MGILDSFIWSQLQPPSSVAVGMYVGMYVQLKSRFYQVFVENNKNNPVYLTIRNSSA